MILAIQDANIVIDLHKAGLLGVQGNVAEWCLDWYGTYAGGSTTDPRGPNEGSLHVYRGGSWATVEGGCRSAFRLDYSYDDGNSFMGFRPVLASGQP